VSTFTPAVAGTVKFRRRQIRNDILGRVAIAPASSKALSARSPSDAGYLVRKKYLVGLMTAAAICANQRKTFSLMSVAVSDFSLVESAESIGIRLPHY
jgi:predicted phage gp36 major capsid-like protein